LTLIPQPVIATALLDTGATKRVAVADVIDRLRLPSMSDRSEAFKFQK